MFRLFVPLGPLLNFVFSVSYLTSLRRIWNINWTLCHETATKNYSENIIIEILWPRQLRNWKKRRRIQISKLLTILHFQWDSSFDRRLPLLISQKWLPSKKANEGKALAKWLIRMIMSPIIGRKRKVCIFWWLENRKNVRSRFPDGRPVTLQEIRLVPSASNSLRLG